MLIKRAKSCLMKSNVMKIECAAKLAQRRAMKLNNDRNRRGATPGNEERTLEAVHQRPKTATDQFGPTVLGDQPN